MLRLRNLMLGLLMAAMAPAGAEASLIMSLSESGGNTVLSYSGQINTTGLVQLGTIPTTASIQPSSGLIQNVSSAQLYFINSGSGSQPFGAGGSASATASSGSPIYANFGGPSVLGLPVGYASGSAITGSMTFAGNFAALGIIDNMTYTFSWGAGGAGNSVTLNVKAVGIPEPATMGVLAIGSVVSGFAYRRRAKMAKLQASV